MTPLTDAELDGLQERLDTFWVADIFNSAYEPPIAAEAASAIRSLRTERDALKRYYGLLLELASDFERERDALRAMQGEQQK